MDAAREQAVKRVVLASSMMVVWGGRGPEGPVGVGERRPNNHYALTKVWAEQMGELYARRFGMSVLAVRLGWMVRTQARRGNGELGFFDCYVSRADGARALAAAVEAEGISFENRLRREPRRRARVRHGAGAPPARFRGPAALARGPPVSIA